MISRTESVRGQRLLEAFLIKKEAAGKRPHTLKDYRRAVEAFLDFAADAADDPRAWDADLIDAWVAAIRRRGCSPTTQDWYRRHLLIFTTWLVQRGEIARGDNPRLMLEPIAIERRRQRTAEPDTIVRLLTAILDQPPMAKGRHRPEHQLRDLAVVHMLRSTGLRREELSWIRVEDVHLRPVTRTGMRVRSSDGEFVPFVRAEHTKTHEPRDLPLDRGAVDALGDYLVERGPEPGPLFLSRYGGAMTSNAIKIMLQRHAARAGVTISSHDFRRAAAASMRRAGMDLGHVMRLLGHSTPTMTLRYSEAGENEAALRAWQRSVGDGPATARRAGR